MGQKVCDGHEVDLNSLGEECGFSKRGICFFFFLIGDLRNENMGCRGDVTSVLFSVGQGYIDMGKMELKIVLVF